MIPWLAGATMRVFVAIFGGHAARFHLTRILAAQAEAARYRETLEADSDDDDDGEDDDEDDQPRRPLNPEWGRVARRAWRNTE